MGSNGGTAAVGLEADNKGTISLTLSHGAFGGLSLQMGILEKNDKQNRAFCRENVTVKEILLDKTVQAPERWEGCRVVQEA